MPRDDLLKGRVSIPGNVYHITSCTDGRRPFFEDFQNGRLLVMESKRLALPLPPILNFHPLI